MVPFQDTWDEEGPWAHAAPRLRRRRLRLPPPPPPSPDNYGAETAAVDLLLVCSTPAAHFACAFEACIKLHEP